mmetsp:Transcript_39536/g.51779  ORF Transcript_39536/g.51779 Transcript_39536/m.51779 type:complete len:93 (+) Transcript_39536:1343-1621(+)
MVGVSDRHTVAHLDFRAIGPLVHQDSQLKHLVDSVAIELFLIDLVFLVFEGKVEPMEDVQRLDRLFEQFGVDGSLDDVLRQDVLDRHDYLVL